MTGMLHRSLGRSVIVLAVWATLCGLQVRQNAAQQQRVVKPNYQQASQYSTRYLQQFLYDTSVRPNWIGESDEFWYSFRTSDGTSYNRVDAARGTKEPLFDRAVLGAQLMELTRKPVDAAQLPITRVEIEKDGRSLKFVVDDTQFQYTLDSQQLTKLGKAPPRPSPPRGGFSSREEFIRFREEQLRQQEQQQEQQQERQQEQQQERRRDDDNEQQEEQRQDDQDQNQTPGGAPTRPDHRAWSPDRTAYVFAKGHDLYFVELPEGYKFEPQEEADKDGEAEKKAQDEQGQSTTQDQQKEDGDQKDSGQKDGEQKDGEQKDGEQKDGEQKDGEQQDKGDGQQQDGQQQEGQQSEESTEGDRQQSGKQDAEKSGTDRDRQKTEGDAKETGDSKSDEQGENDAKQKEQTQDDKQQSDKQQSEQQQKQQDQQKEQQQEQQQEKEQQGEQQQQQAAGDAQQEEQELPIPRIDPKLDDAAVRLSQDGAEEYSFSGRSSRFGRRGGGSAQQEQTIGDDTRTRPNVNWSKDSAAFYVTRRDGRGVKELWVINSLAQPRPALEKYPYPMPGDENIRKAELHYFRRGADKLTRIEPKWTDEGYADVHWSKDAGDELRFVRRDRLLRNIELCAVDLNSGQTQCLLSEGFEDANISPQSLRYLKDTDEMIWWSERSGWGHFYLYGREGTLKNPITSGEFRAERIVDVDEKNRQLYFTASGREPGENIYQAHLYSVHLDGTGLRLMDPGDAHHSSTLSPSKQYLVDNCSRVDMQPKAILRDASGREIMVLESADLSRLEQVGWRMPETFVVKAADGVTDLYGNMWKPFDFDSEKQYPIVAHVYPGPQTEGTRHTFSATAGEQQLAQLGFIVIQVGHRGGSPGRSKAYASYGYYNLRDYGLADKKAAIEQLAQRFPFIDIERVGIYGHSGGGFMTAAAMLREPYNDFFKVGVATAGNHDNNIYNNSWSERYHGLKVAQEEQQQTRRSGSRGSRRDQQDQQDQQEQQQEQREQDGAFQVEASDYFYEYELLDDQHAADLEAWEQAQWWEKAQLQWDWEQQIQQQDEQKQEQQKQEELSKEQQQEQKEKTNTGQDSGDQNKQMDEKTDQQQTDQTKERQSEDGEKSNGQRTKFEIQVPTNAELAANLKGHLFLIHGELDNNVHPANTLRLVDALIKAEKRFDMLYLPATRHGFGQYQPYVTQRMFEYFAEHLLDDYQSGADINEKKAAPKR